MDDTLLEFGGAGGGSALQPAERRSCPVCGSRFSGDARFCPFDGELLVEGAPLDVGADPLLGAVVDNRYQVIRVLGEGGMGTVYEVEHVTLQKRFALKALRRDLSRFDDLSARFIQEAKAAAAISHPNVVQIVDFGHLPTGEAYFVMELLGGVPLSRHLHDSGSVSPERAAHILRQVSEALAAAHQSGIIHRDLKPDNIQICDSVGERELVKVLDFGLARVAGKSRLTRAGVVFGTPHYMSPEQAAGETLDQRSDVYALGVVMYEMLTGRVPFEADTFMGVLNKHIAMLPTPPSELVSDPGSLGVLEDITLRCLQKRPENRFGSMLELLDHLEAAVHQDSRGAARVRPSAFASDAMERSGGGAAVRRSFGQRLAKVGHGWPLGPAHRTALAVAGAVVGGVGAIALGTVVFGTAPSATPQPKQAAAAEPSAASTVVLPAPQASGEAQQQVPDDESADTDQTAGEPDPSPSSPPQDSASLRRSRSSPAGRTPAPAPVQPKRRARKDSRIGGGDIVNPWEN